MSLTEITDENKYEIVSNLREYKHKIFNLSEEETDILFPKIKSYILSKEPLKLFYLNTLEDYNKIKNSESYKQNLIEFESNISKINKSSIRHMTALAISRFYSSFVIYIKDFAIDNKKIFHEYSSTGELLYNQFVDTLFTKIATVEDYDLITEPLKEIFYLIDGCIDFKIFEAEEFTPYSVKKINYIRMSTFYVLSTLESYILNNQNKMNEVIHNVSKDTLSQQAQRVYNYILELKEKNKTEIFIDDIINKSNTKAKNKVKHAQNIISVINKKMKDINLSKYIKDDCKYNIL